jgi:hypothetical protein
MRFASYGLLSVQFLSISPYPIQAKIKIALRIKLKVCVNFTPFLIFAFFVFFFKGTEPEYGT